MKKYFRGFVLVLALSLIITSFPIAYSFEINLSDWTTAGFDNARTGNNVDEHTLRPPLKSSWVQRFELYYPSKLSVFGDLLATGGMVAKGDTELTNQVRMLDIYSGKTLWTFDLNAGGAGDMGMAPVFSGDNIYFGGQADDKLYAVNASTGELVWENTGFAPRGIYTSQIAILDNRLFMPNQVDSVTVFDANTGELLWGHTEGVWVQPLTIRNNLVFGFRVDGTILRANDTDTGEVIWELEGFEGVFHWITASENNIYVNISTTDVASINIANGEIVWRTTLPVTKLLERGIVLTENTLFVPVWTDENHFGSVIALDRSSGTQLWKFNSFGEGVMGLAFANDILYVTGWSASKVYALNPVTGEQIWSANLDGSGGDVIVANRRLFVTSGNAIYAFENQ